MAVKPEYRDRDEVEVEVLGALTGRADDGMTVFEIRAAVDADIDRLEVALADLKESNLIRTDHEGDRLVIYPADHVVANPNDAEDDDPSLIDAIRNRIGL